ncbi:NUDIX domain-containing protein [Patescibacteria group bacterium]|nr:NUDIX domain-containing protein [Patescibacteria group bacterium]MBU4480969.1 NUDIX domain-containing protein [Patescibacteria group bacterium]
MPIEKSAGAIIFRKEDNEIYYLLLNYPSSTKSARTYWDFPKGHIEKGETIEETVKREVKEETGLKDIKLVEGFKEWIKYFFKFKGKNIFKIVVFLLAETPHQNPEGEQVPYGAGKFGTGQAKTKEVKISFEHIGYEWLPYEEALGRLTFKNAKEVLIKAHQYLFKN